jgi:hypothetical protein
MNKEDIKKARKHFRTWGELNRKRISISKEVYSCYLPVPCKGIYTNRETEFRIVIMTDDKVYQVGSEWDIIGIELETFEDLKIRYKSFTGENLE